MTTPCETLPTHLRGRVIWYYACTRTTDLATRRHIFVCQSKTEAKHLAKTMEDADRATDHIGWVAKNSDIGAITTTRPVHVSDPHGLLTAKEV